MEKLLTKIDEKIHLHDSQNLSFGTLSELSDFWGKNNKKKSLTIRFLYLGLSKVTIHSHKNSSKSYFATKKRASTSNYYFRRGALIIDYFIKFKRNIFIIFI